MSLLDWLKEVGQRNHEDTLALIDAHRQQALNQASVHNRRRMESQVDAVLKRMFCGDYTPPVEDMGHTFINSPIISEEMAKTLGIAIKEESSTEKPDSPTAAPTAAFPHAPASSGFLTSMLKTMLPLLVTAGISIAAAKYFAPEPPTDIYDIEAMPYVPPEGIP